VRLALLTTLLAAGGVTDVSCGACGRGSPDKGPAPQAAVAVVNGEPIPADALARELRDTRAGVEGGGAPAQGDVLRRRVLDDLVERTLLLQEARARSVAVGQDQVERAFLRVRAEYPGTHFDDLLAQERLSQTDLKAKLKEQLTLERLFEQEVFPGVTVQDGEIAKYYADHAGEFDAPERVHVSQIVVASRDEAQQLRERLRQNPQTFAEVAKKSSIAPEGKAGGDLGLVGKGSGFPEVFDVCFTQPLNTISDVTPSPYGFHLFRVTERRQAEKRTLEQAKAEIGERLSREKRVRAQADFVETLRKRAQISIDEKMLAAVTP
jgi:peptidyl-prolyl cis-trans isomerase C